MTISLALASNGLDGKYGATSVVGTDNEKEYILGVNKLYKHAQTGKWTLMTGTTRVGEYTAVVNQSMAWNDAYAMSGEGWLQADAQGVMTTHSLKLKFKVSRADANVFFKQDGAGCVACDQVDWPRLAMFYGVYVLIL